ncbi:unnamed protein product [Rotaria sordida]|uniref:Proteasome activator complex subunit 4 n=1 Tax=Rotaria sordida TaxID=392033 RepID=A0A814GKS8_9BILA|nr:unnamed protein product [Rotaria sordida]
MRLIIDIGKLLDHLVDRHSDDASSISTALQIYSLPSCYFGLLANDYAKLNNDFDILKYSFENKLSGRRYHPRFVIIKRLAKEIQSFSIDNYQSLTKIDKQVILKLVELSINRYSQVRCIAQIYLFTMLQRYVFSYNVVVDRILKLLNAPGEADHDEIKHVPIPSSCIRTFSNFLVHDNVKLRMAASPSISTLCRLQKLPRIYVEKTLEEILHRPINTECHPGDRDDNLWLTINDYIPPKSQAEWEQTCFLDKSFHGYYKWPKIIKYPLNKRERYTRENMPEQVAILYNRFIDKNFVAKFIQLMVLDKEGDSSFDVNRFRMFKGLFRNFGSAFVDHFMEQLYALIREKIIEIQEGSQRVAAEIVAGMIRGSKYWTVEMLDELWSKLTPFLNELCMNLSSEAVLNWGCCFWFAVADVDPRRTYHTVEFMRSLINTPSTANTFIETSRWNLVEQLRNFEWRIPAVWHEVNAHAKDLLEHPYKAVRECIASVLGTSLSHDITLPNGQSTRHPSVNLFFDGIHERLQRAIDICEKAPLANISGEIVGIDSKVRQALNFIETVIQLCIELTGRSLQPIKHGIIRLFPDLCSIESIVANDESLRDRLTLNRMATAVTYLHVPFIEAFIEQIEYVCKSSKWHARRAAIEFVQHMIFCNLFNARPFAPRIREIVLKCLFDEQLEVRTIASVTLAGFYQCGFIQITKEDLEYFRLMSKTNYFIRVDGKKVTSTENIVKRHGGVLGLCAIVLSSPYDIPIHIPRALMLLCEHSHDPNLIRKSIKNALSEFRRTHHDSWHEHREKFTEDQLVILADVLISPNYYA